MKKLLAFVSLLTISTYALASDSCISLIPKTLVKELSEKYPHYRLALSTDQDSKYQSMVNPKYQKGECTTVAKGDFNGDTSIDYALYIAEKETLAPKLIAAISENGHWKVNELPQWNNRIINCYVEVAEPGVYSHTESFDFSPSDKQEREEVTIKTSGIMAGLVAST